MCMSIVASAFQYGWPPTLMPGHDDVDLTAGLGEAHDPLQRGRDPVHVLGARVHRDPGARTTARTTRPGRPAARRGRARRSPGCTPASASDAERLGRVAEQHHPRDALGVARGRGARPGRPRCRRCSCPAAGPPARARLVVVEVVLGEGAVGPGQQAGQLVRVDGAAAGRAQHLLPVVVERRDRLGRRRLDAAACTARPASRVIRTASSASSRSVASGAAPAADDELDLLQPGAGHGRPDPVHAAESAPRRLKSVARPDVHHDPVGLEPLVLRPAAPAPCGSRRGTPARTFSSSGSATRRPSASRSGVRSRTWAIATSRSSARLLLATRQEQVDLLVGGRQPGEVELAQPVELQPLGDLRVQPADQPVLGQPPRSGCGAVGQEGEVVVHRRRRAAGATVDGAPGGRWPAAGRALEQLGQPGGDAVRRPAGPPRRRTGRRPAGRGAVAASSVTARTAAGSSSNGDGGGDELSRPVRPAVLGGDREAARDVARGHVGQLCSCRSSGG